MVNRFIQTGELHGDGRCDSLARALQNDTLSRRMSLAEAFDRCREWGQIRAVPAWQRVGDCVLKTADRLVLQVMESGRLAARWGENLIDDALSVGELAPSMVTLGDQDDLRSKRCSVAIESGESAIRCELRFFAAKDGLISVELHANESLPERSFGELWKEECLLQQLPIANGLASFSRRLAAGSYRIVLRVGDQRHEITVDIA